MEGLKMAKVPLRRTVRFKGLPETAAEIGCSVFHLREVLHGRRKPGAELAAKLEARGIRVGRRRGAAAAKG